MITTLDERLTSESSRQLEALAEVVVDAKQSEVFEPCLVERSDLDQS